MNRVETSRFRLCAWTLLALAAQSVGTGVRGESLSIEFRSGGSGVLLRGAGSSQQVIARADATSGNGGRDVTREVRWTVVPDSLAVLDQGGRLMALKDGEGSVVATAPDGTTGSLPLRVQDTAIDGPLHFANQIVPLFTRYGCNGGGCHGKAAGQNGFRLSLLGFEPAEDYEHLVREARGRRLFPAAPEHSLLLLKATGQLPHGGVRG